MPEIDLELRMALTIQSETKDGIEKRFVAASLHNASYQNKFNYDVSGLSILRVKIASLPATTGAKGA